jgi:ABC-type multidrug transport system fused ATPase/permease subunit
MQKNGQRLRQRKNKLQKEQHKQNKVAQVVVDNIQQITENARIERKKRTENEPYEAISSDDENTTRMDEQESSSDDDDIHAIYAKNHPTHIFYLLFLIFWTVGLIYYAYLNIK